MYVDDDRRWKPRHNRTLLVAPLDGQGFDEHGIFVPESTERFRMIGYVLTTKHCEEVAPGDIVFFEEGAQEELTTASGESLCWLHETRCTAIDSDFWAKPKAEEVTASGLIIPAIC